jgi:serine/threonine protein kinase/ketosteroid isomerase-like protein
MISSTNPMRHLGRYRLEAEIARGISGVVYRAVDPNVGRPVAIKVVDLNDAVGTSRISRQADASVRLAHKNILTVVEYVEDDTSAYLVMEYLEGASLRALLDSRSPLSMFEKTSLMVQVADALRHAHELGIIHGDINPANINVSPDGAVKILNFGTAGVSEGLLPRVSLQYVAPEALQGGSVDALCDVYSYGVVYFELVTGNTPFGSTGSDLAQLIYKIVSRDPALVSSIDPNCPPPLVKLIDRSLRKDRSQRYPSLGDLIQEHERIYFELQSGEAELLIQTAGKLRDDGNPSEAKKQVLQALTLNPGSSAGRALLDDLNREIQAKAQREKALQLLEFGRKKLSLAEYAQAIEAFEGVLALDSQNGQAAELIAKAQEVLKRRERRDVLIASAHQDLQSGRLDEASKHTLECLQDNPADGEATFLLERIKDARERQIRHQAALKVVAEIRDLISRSEYVEAVSRSTKALQEFPDEGEIGELKATAEKSALEKQREQLIGEVLDKASALIRSKDFEGAIRLLRENILKLGAVPALEELSASASEKLREQKTAAAVQSTLNRVRQLIGSDRLHEAIGLLEDALTRFPGEESLGLLLAEARHLRDTQRNREINEQILRDARRAMGRGDLAGAERIVRDRIANDPHEIRLGELLEEICQEGARIQRTRAAQAALEDASLLENQGLLQQAAELLEAALKSDAAQANVRIRLQGLRARIARQKDVGAAVDTICSLMSGGMYKQALEHIDAAVAAFPDEQAFSSFREEVQRSQHVEAVSKACRDITAVRSTNNLREALARAEKGLRDFPNEASILTLKAELEAEIAAEKWHEEIADTLSRAKRLLNLRQIDEAKSLLAQCLVKYPEDKDLIDLFERANQSAAERDRAKTIADLVHKVDEMLAKGLAQSALAELVSAAGKFPDEAILQRLLERARADVALLERNASRERILERAGQEHTKHGAHRAVKVLERGVMDLPDDQQLLDALGKMRAEARDLEQAQPLKSSASRRYGIVAASVLLVLIIGSTAYWFITRDTRVSGNIPSPVVPKILSFYADPPAISRGTSAKICYETENARTITIEPRIDPQDTSPARCFDVLPEQTSEYRLTVVSADGSEISQTLVVTVSEKKPVDVKTAEPTTKTVDQPQPADPPDPARERDDWARTNKLSLDDLKRFLEKYPNGEHSTEARAKAQQLEASNENIGKVVSTAQAYQQAVLETLDQYAAAVKAGNVDEIMRVSPNENRSLWEATFNQRRKIVNLEWVKPELFQDGTAVTVRGTQRVTYRSERGETNDESKRFTAKLQRNGQRWQITSLQFGP